MNTQNQNQADGNTVIKGTSSSNPIAKIIGVLMLCALAAGAYYYFQSQSENEKAREELLKTSELIGNNPQEAEKNAQSDEAFNNNALSDASTHIEQQSSQTKTETPSESTSSTSATANEDEEIDQYLGFKIVTEADPDAQAAVDSEERQKSLESFEQEVLAQNAQGTNIEGNDSNDVLDEENNVVAKSHDNIISARFIDGFANYLVENYQNFSKSSPMKASAFYGANLKDLPQSAGIAQSREFIINYLYKADTLAKLHVAYEDQFLAAYKKYANSPNKENVQPTGAQVRRMNAYYANYASSLAQALRAISDVPDFKQQMISLYAAESALALTRASFAKTQVEFDEARYANKSTTLLGGQLKSLASEIEKTTAKLKSVEEELVGKIMQQTNVSLSTQDLTNLCRWLARREVQMADYSAWQDTNRELANIFSNISVKIKQ